MCGAAFAIATSSSSGRSFVDMTAIIAPAVRICLVMARVSTPWMPTMLFFFKILVERQVGASPVAHDLACLFDDKARKEQLARFDIFGIDAVIADKGYVIVTIWPAYDGSVSTS